jgi:hypothetical protein
LPRIAQPRRRTAEVADPVVELAFKDWGWRRGSDGNAALRAGLGAGNHRVRLFAGQRTELVLNVVPELFAVIEKLFALDVELFGELVDTLTLILCQAAPLLRDKSPAIPVAGAARR